MKRFVLILAMLFAAVSIGGEFSILKLVSLKSDKPGHWVVIRSDGKIAPMATGDSFVADGETFVALRVDGELKIDGTISDVVIVASGETPKPVDPVTPEPVVDGDLPIPDDATGAEVASVLDTYKAGLEAAKNKPLGEFRSTNDLLHMLQGKASPPVMTAARRDRWHGVFGRVVERRVAQIEAGGGDLQFKLEALLRLFEWIVSVLEKWGAR